MEKDDGDGTDSDDKAIEEEELPPGSDGKCDMCWGSHGEHGFRLLQCRKCHVRVHDECYGYTASTTDDDDNNNEESFWFTCWACQAVGSIVKFRDRDPESGERLQVVVDERPTECCLCNVDDGIEVPHAMHPLFDDYGNKARQIRLLPSKPSALGRRQYQQQQDHPDEGGPQSRRPSKIMLPERPAWVHTICAMFLSSSKGGSFLFGCCKDGSYGGEGDDDDDDDDDDENSDEKAREDKDPNRLVWEDDDDSINSELVDEVDNSSDDKDEDILHHFTVVNEKWYGPDHHVIKACKEKQRLLKCILCANKNEITKEKILQQNFQVPLQCNANDDDEWERGQGTHVDLRGNDCYQAMHVGCAFYGSGSRNVNCRRVYFFPGCEDEDPIMALYCDAHAKDLPKYDRDDDQNDVDFDAGDIPDEHEDEVEIGPIDQHASELANQKRRKLNENYPHYHTHRPQGPNNSRMKLLQKMDRKRPSESSSRDLSIRAATGGSGGGHSKSFGQTSSSSFPSKMQRSSSLTALQQQYIGPKVNKHIMRRPRIWNRNLQNEWKATWKARYGSGAAPPVAVKTGPKQGNNASSSGRTSSVENINIPFHGNLKALRMEIQTDLSERLKKAGSAEERTGITKSVRAKWGKSIDKNMTAENFKKVFERARINVMKGTNTLYKRDIVRRVDVDAFLDKRGMDSIQKGQVKSMLEKFIDALRRLNVFDRPTVKKCSSTMASELKKVYTSMNPEEFNNLWKAAKKLASQMFELQKLPEENEESRQEPPPSDSGAAVNSTGTRDGNDDNNTNEMNVDNGNPAPSEPTNEDTKTTDANRRSMMDSLYREAVQNVMKCAKSARHLPLQTILDDEKEDCGETYSKLSQEDFDLVWKRVVKQSRKWYQEKLPYASKPMDWSFLVVSPSYNIGETNDYISRWDIFGGDDDDYDDILCDGNNN